MNDPTPVQQVHQIAAWTAHDVLLETHRYAPGPASADRIHAHDAYQLCLSLDFPGEYHYRGATLAVPIGSLSIIHPGEPHAARDPSDRTAPATYRVLYVAPALLRQLAMERAGHPVSAPFFAQPIVTDAQLVASWLQLHAALERAHSLATHTLLLHALGQLVDRYGAGHPAEHVPATPCLELERARDYLHAHAAQRLTLNDLAAVAGLSPYHLCRAFGQAFGLPPHRYQTLVRIDRAKQLLAAGVAPGEVALATGFSDQSHFGRHFKRVVGVAPAAYAGQTSRSAKTC